ncbi:TPA: hypothetical protein ACF2DS_002420 [Clostridium perfringens]|uniref:hypothetical protein n=1 Tax=Clostridium perfringens TaxID=1502 RepID=UPI0013DE611E|nr:hypothetical protein [Clostridium perfringens]EJT6339309.1 hypothetical protein [Clostridium perfringens]MBO3388430.1 hypothetical protein [Clostridium perfringens]MBO3414860.1 hypothetical protein [Clostridium perfringens]UBK99107.1 hypothetical protein KLF26_07735 [Clostridium perfringens]CAJ1610895.1 hypothetical protein CLO5623_02367 [Clostridium perfringens]
MAENRTKSKQVKIRLSDEKKEAWELYLKNKGLKSQEVIEEYIDKLLEATM